MTIRTYGTLTRDGGEWILDVEPHVAMMVKRVFTRVTREGQKLTLKHNPETCRQLDWLTKLYPLTCPDQTQLDQIVVAHNDRLAEAERIVQPGYEPRVFDVKLPPRDYQRLGAELYLNSKSLLLADVVGAGKTLTAICSLCDPRTLPAVIVCPPHLLMQWERELTRCAPDLFVHTITKRRPYTLPTRDGRGPDVLLLSYFRADGWEDALRGYAKSVVFEEAQELRRRDSQKYQACKLIAADCEFRLQLSGTPIFNYGGEIYSLVQILRPDFLGDYEEFCREWCVGAWDKPRLKDPDAFGSFLREQHLMLRRTLKDIKRELPPLQKITQMIDSDAKAMASIDGAAGELARTLMAETELTRGDKMRAAGDLEMLVRQATGIAKAPYVAAFVELLLESDEPVVVFAWHRGVHDILASKLAKYRPAFYTGEESAVKKQTELDRFLTGDTNLLVISLRSGSGIDGLQFRCRTCVFAELDWSPAVHEQCYGRVARDGQTDPVTVYYLLADAGSDPPIAEMLGLKQSQIDGLMGVKHEGPFQQFDPTVAMRKLAESYLTKH